ncbi:phosphotransferase family protein [Sphingobium boeckii]|uniref:Aminoglycoside phosphotransferase (APT) family kinase protein n=1 Tax=Sphingobium boeckii TaxID=1082345 RepID=A0A7W9AI25_9SPHN|nr:phosphotransferase family protein [Sphingobium boeckii]MBB5685871.1 aminoglycoside phosphotransferase (APT) family kinase protein [Sphingobium boeckii]
MKPLTEEALITYLAQRMPDWRDIRIEGLHRLPLGASRETFRFDLSYSDANGRHEDRLILRRDPPASNVDSDRRHEYESYRAIHGHGVPVPRMILLEEDPEHFGGAISLAEDLRGYHNSEYQLQEAAWRDRLPRIAQQFWTSMGTLAAVPVDALDLSFMKPATPEGTAMQELDFWEATLDKNDVGAEPITRAAIRWMRRNPPPPAQKLAMVHGDFRAGNFLYDDEGHLIAVLDWEMAHQGDPLEDLAWSLARVFSFGKDERRSGIALREEAIAIWQAASGLEVDPAALHWWELLNCIKGQGIWNSCAHVWSEGTNRDVIHAYAAWWLRNAQDRAILELMGKL